jgi:hypothetical protein
MGLWGGPIGHRTFAVGSSVTQLESLPSYCTIDKGEKKMVDKIIKKKVVK